MFRRLREPKPALLDCAGRIHQLDPQCLLDFGRRDFPEQACQLLADMVDRLLHATLDRIRLMTLGFRWNDRSLGPSSSPARLGEHTDQVLAWLSTESASRHPRAA